MGLKNIIYSEVLNSELASTFHESVLVIEFSESGSSVLGSQKVNNTRTNN